MSKQTTPRKKNASFLRFFRIFKGIKMPWLFLILAVAAQVGMYLATSNIAILTGTVVDAGGNIADAKVTKYVISYVFITVAMFATQVLDGYAAERINMGLRNKLWKKLMYIPQKHYDRDGSEGLVTRITTDCDFASTLFTTIITSLTTVFGLYLYIRNMARLNATMTIYMSFLPVVSVLIGWGYGKLQYWVGKKVQGTLSGTMAYLIERTQNLRLIKAAGTESEEDARGNQKFIDQYKAEIKQGYVNVLYLGIEKFVYLLGLIVPFVIGGKLVSENVMTVGQVVAFYTFAGSLTGNFTSLINSFGSIKQAIGSLERVSETFELESEDVESGERMVVPDADITLSDLVFAYDEEPVLKGLNCTIPKNKTTAIIGANGSGKSTMFKLLERFYDPSSGTILFGDADISRFSRHAWRKAFAFVAQDRPIMEGTIRENITYGCERLISDEKLKTIADMARVSAFAEKLPDGYDSYVAPGGTNFSGGQRQCIAIARAIAHNPDYLLLDEATSNLDAKSERFVTDALNNLMQNRTTVIIAHHLSAIRHADHVIILKDGKVATSGSPDEIIKTSSDYRDFVMNQKCACEA